MRDAHFESNFSMLRCVGIPVLRPVAGEVRGKAGLIPTHMLKLLVLLTEPANSFIHSFI